MSHLIAFIITTLVTAVSLIILSKLPLGIEIDSFQKAVISAIVLGIVNGILSFISFPLTFLTLGLFAFVVNIVAFGLAAWLVEGFRLRWGIWSALLGAIALSIVNSILYKLLEIVHITR